MITQEGLTTSQAEFFNQNGYLVLPNFVEDDACLKLREQAMILAKKYCPSPQEATVFTADGTAVHASDDYFLTSGDKIRCFFEKDAFDEHGVLRTRTPGAPLPALGEGSVCEFCAVRGLCRKDYWADAEQALPAPETP